MSFIIYGLVFIFGSLGSGAIFRWIEIGIAVAVVIVLIAEFVLRSRIEKTIMGANKLKD